MKTYIKSKLILALLPLALIFLAGCGNQTNEETSPAPTNASAAQPPTGMTPPATPVETNTPAVTNQ